jgi:hypothetical protein
MHPTSHAVKRVLEEEPRHEPYTHMVVDGIFSDDFYEQMLAHFPEPRDMVHPHSATHTYLNVWQADIVPDPVIKAAASGAWKLERVMKNRDKLAFWRNFRSYFFDNAQFATALLAQFADAPFLAREHLKGPPLPYSVGRLAIDLEGAGLGPHTDRADKLISVVFYLADGSEGDEIARACGTELLEPKYRARKKVLTDSHLTHDLFKDPEVVEYRPNRMIAWPVTADSFHAYHQSATHERRTIKMFVQEKSMIGYGQDRVVATADAAHDWRGNGNGREVDTPA